MPRPKGSKNKAVQATPHTLALSTEERIEFLTELILDKLTQVQEAEKLKEE